MRFSSFIMMVIVLAVAALPAQAKKQRTMTDEQIQADITAKLEGAWKQQRLKGVKAVVLSTGLDTFLEQKTVAKWAFSRYNSPYERDAHIGLIYSQALAAMGWEYLNHRKNDAYRKTMVSGAGIFISSQIIAFEDIARCADKSAGADYLSTWMKDIPYETYKEFIAKTTEAERQRIWAAAKKIADERNTERADKALCESGADAISKAQMDPTCKKDIEACDLKQFVELVDDAAWKTRRDQVQALIRTRVEEGKI